jgi:hemerythrin-like domain-containing protein
MRKALPMTSISVRVMHDEHQALAAVLRSMSMMLTEARRLQALPDFAVLRAMLFYIDEFPQQLHHARESELLFPRLREKAPELAPVLDRLDREHAAGETMIRELGHALLAFEMMGRSRWAAFEDRLERYVRFYLAHMSTEEREVLPAAQARLSAQDWGELDAAFTARRDPLTGYEPEEDYREVFRRIVDNAPAPIGLGPAMRKAA